MMANAETKKPHYTVVIQWDDDDQRFIVSLPEWGPYCKTHGETYEEAAKNAREVLELLMEKAGSDSTKLPPARHFHYPGAGVIDLPDNQQASAENHLSNSNLKKRSEVGAV